MIRLGIECRLEMASTWCTSVLLGRIDASCPDPHLSPYENKVGGYPDFFPSSVLHSPPCCHCCKSPLLLLVQVYCPLEASPYHRLMHVFCCPQPACWNQPESWLVLRSQLKDPSYGSSKVGEGASDAISGTVSSAATEWCEEAEDWGSDSEETVHRSELEILTTCPTAAADSYSPSNMVARIEDLSLEGYAAKPPPYEGPFFPPSYVTVHEEPFEDKYSAKVEELLKRYRREDPDFVANSDLFLKKNGSSERYEKSVASHGDRAFQKFHKQLSRCPDQIVRYSWKGSPLMITDHPAPKETKCKFCGSSCVFEFQLMPPLVYLLQKSIQARTETHHSASVKVNSSTANSRPGTDCDGIEHQCVGRESPVVPSPLLVEFGTVLVYSCSQSCWEDKGGTGFQEECVIVQADPDERICADVRVSV